MGWNRSSESGGANTPGSPHVGQPKFALRSKGEGTARGKSPRPRWLRGAVAALIVVVGAGIATWWLLTSPKPHPATPVPHPVKAIPEAKPAAAPASMRTNESTVAQSAEPAEPWKDEYIKDPKKRLKFSTLFEARTNSAGMITERFRLPNGKTWRRVTDPPPIFDNMADDAIASVIAGGAGAPIPPVPGLDNANLDEEFAKAMASPIKIGESDSPKLVALKMAVKETKKEIARMIKEGDTRSVGEILQDHINLNNRNANLQAEAFQAVSKVREEMGDEAAESYLEKVNENLKSYGVNPIHVGKGRNRGEHQEKDSPSSEKE